jgi:hypothetical protein
LGSNNVGLPPFLPVSLTRPLGVSQ